MAKNYTPNQNNRQAYDTLTEGAATLPPQAVELEEAVLGALMLEGDSITTVQEFLTADAFYLDTHRIIYRAIEELCSENKPVDLLTVTEKLKRQKKLKEVGPFSRPADAEGGLGDEHRVPRHHHRTEIRAAGAHPRLDRDTAPLLR